VSLRVFGCKALVDIPRNQRLKDEEPTKTCIFIGHCRDSNGRTNRFYDPKTKRVIRSLDATFYETEFPALSKQEAQARAQAAPSVPAPALEFIFGPNLKDREGGGRFLSLFGG